VGGGCDSDCDLSDCVDDEFPGQILVEYMRLKMKLWGVSLRVYRKWKEVRR
jgi:hypothetical protein